MISIPFIVLSTIAFILSFLVITMKQTVHAAFALVAVFVLTGAIWLMMAAEFLAALLILVYVGAIMVLFLFVVMMTQYQEQKTEGFSGWRAVVMLFVWGVSMHSTYLFLAKIPSFWEPAAFQRHAPIDIAQILFNEYFIAFEMIGVFLLAVMIAAVALTFRGHKQRHVQNIYDQLAATKQNRLSLH